MNSGDINRGQQHIWTTPSSVLPIFPSLQVIPSHHVLEHHSNLNYDYSIRLNTGYPKYRHVHAQDDPLTHYSCSHSLPVQGTFHKCKTPLCRRITCFNDPSNGRRGAAMGSKPLHAACPRNIFLAVSGLARYMCGTINDSMLGVRGCM